MSAPTSGNRRKNPKLLLAISAALAAGGAGAAGPAPAPPAAPPAATVASPYAVAPDVSWRRLAFRASKLLVSAHAEVALEWRQAREVAPELAETDQGAPLAPAGERVAHLTVTSNLLGRSSSTQVWLDPLDLRVLQRRQLEEGKRERLKLYRFGRSGIYSRRVRPSHGERGQPLQRWTDVQEGFEAHQEATPVSDPSALFYWLSAIEPESLREGRTLVVYSKSLLNPVEVRYLGVEEIRVDYRLYGVADPEGNAIDVSGRVPALRFSLTPGAGGADELELLGLEGDLELHVDAEHRVPVQVSGRVPPVGKVVARLQEAWLAPQVGR
ncbi:MAG TPA: hypothetical protein VMV46_18465 [Thermoanaerobaculia bacterium]|nr:hypothetical protein [Thermoanaerobaculia bacterium]